MDIDELHAAQRRGAGPPQWPRLPLIEAPAPAASEPASSKQTLGQAGPLDLSPFRWFTGTVHQSLRWGMPVVPGHVRFESRRGRAKPQLTPSDLKEAEAATASFSFLSSCGPHGPRGEGRAGFERRTRRQFPAREPHSRAGSPVTLSSRRPAPGGFRPLFIDGPAKSTVIWRQGAG